MALIFRLPAVLARGRLPGILLLGLCVFPIGARAEDEPGPMSEEVKYVGIQPTLVTNVGVSETGRLSYLKADISLQVKSPSAHGALLSHMPAVRNLLVLALSRQDQATVSSADGRESLRAEALKELQAFFQKESGSPVVSDLLFTNFIVQT